VFNSSHDELENTILDTGMTLDPDAGPDTDLHMLGKASAAYGASGDYYIDSGSGTAYILARALNLQAPPFIVDGLRVSFIATTANTGAATVTITGVGAAKALRHKGGGVLAAGVISLGMRVDAVYYAAGDYYVLENPAFRGCLVYRNTDQVITTSTDTDILFSTSFAVEDYDTSEIHSLVTNPQRLTVPAGVSRVRLLARVTFDINATGLRSLAITKNVGGAFVGSPYKARLASSLPPGHHTLFAPTPVLRVVPGDYFRMQVRQESGGDLAAEGSVTGDQTWFAMEIVS
jgi:hypothetical protein